MQELFDVGTRNEVIGLSTHHYGSSNGMIRIELVEHRRELFTNLPRKSVDRFTRCVKGDDGNLAVHLNA